MPVLHCPAKIFVAHGDRALHKVSERVGKVRIDPLDKQFPGDDTVVLVRHLMQHEITDSIHAEEINEIVGINDVAFGFAHLLAALQEPRMSEDLLRKRFTERHQENRPVNGMEADDILADEVQIRRPFLFIKIRAVPIGVISDAGDIVAQRIKPYIDNMARVKVHRNAPLEARAGDAQILQSREQEVIHHLIAPRNGLDEFRMRVDVFDQARRIFLHAEEICLFLLRMDISSADRAFSLRRKLRLRVERLALRAVQAVILSLVNIALLIKALENLLNLDDMVLVRRADEAIVGCVHEIPDALNFCRRFVDEFLRLHALFNSTRLYLLPVLIGAGLEPDIVSVRPLITCNRIRKNNLVGIADMRLARRVGNCRCDVVFSFILHITCFSLVKTRRHTRVIGQRWGSGYIYDAPPGVFLSRPDAVSVYRLIRNNLAAVLRDKDLHFPLCRRLSVLGVNAPAVAFILINFIGSGIDHRLDGEAESRNHQHSGSRCRDIAHIRVFVEFEPAAVSADFLDDRETVLQCMLMHCISHVAHERPWLCCLDADLHAFLCDPHQFLLLFRDLADTVHSGRVREKSVQDRAAVDIDDVAFLQDNLIRRNTMADLLVDGGADTLRIALIVKVRWNASHFDRRIVDDIVNFLRCHAGMNLLANFIKNRNVDLRALANTFHLRRRFDEGAVRNLRALELICTELLVKRLMAVLVLFSTAAPAWSIAVNFFLRKPDQSSSFP